MFTTIGIPASLVGLAARQAGVFSANQAEASGMTRAAMTRLHRDGHWHGIVPGISSIQAAPPFLGLAWAGILQSVERAHNLPPATRQFSISKGTRSDAGYPQYGLIVELDGQVWHEGPAAWADMARDNCHGLLFFTTLRFGWHAVVTDPCSVASKVAEALRQGGWQSSLGCCARCR